MFRILFLLGFMSFGVACESMKKSAEISKKNENITGASALSVDPSSKEEVSNFLFGDPSKKTKTNKDSKSESKKHNDGASILKVDSNEEGAMSEFLFGKPKQKSE